MNEKIKNILSVYVLRLQWLIYDLKTCSLDEDPITLHLTGGDITISLNPKNKTTMDREQAKELLPIIQAFAEGKTIQSKRINGTWIDLEMKTALNIISLIDQPQKYRIKPGPKYRSFANAEECWQEMKKHEPFGWVKYKTDDVYSFICKVEEDRCYFAVNVYWAFDTILEKYTFADGTPFGIKEE
ncbi:hypothetical protein [Prevotella sp.]|nr:hypothetical protein [Prevotella sp.]